MIVSDSKYADLLKDVFCSTVVNGGTVLHYAVQVSIAIYSNTVFMLDMDVEYTCITIVAALYFFGYVFCSLSFYIYFCVLLYYFS